MRHGNRRRSRRNGCRAPVDGDEAEEAQQEALHGAAPRGCSRSRARARAASVMVPAPSGSPANAAKRVDADCQQHGPQSRDRSNARCLVVDHDRDQRMARRADDEDQRVVEQRPDERDVDVDRNVAVLLSFIACRAATETKHVCHIRLKKGLDRRHQRRGTWRKRFRPRGWHGRLAGITFGGLGGRRPSRSAGKPLQQPLALGAARPAGLLDVAVAAHQRRHRGQRRPPPRCLAGRQRAQDQVEIGLVAGEQPALGSPLFSVAEQVEKACRAARAGRPGP